MIKVTDITAFGFKIDGKQYSLKEFRITGREGTCNNCILNSETLLPPTSEDNKLYTICLGSVLCNVYRNEDNELRQLQYVEDEIQDG